MWHVRIAPDYLGGCQDWSDHKWGIFSMLVVLAWYRLVCNVLVKRAWNLLNVRCSQWESKVWGLRCEVRYIIIYIIYNNKCFQSVHLGNIYYYFILLTFSQTQRNRFIRTKCVTTLLSGLGITLLRLFVFKVEPLLLLFPLLYPRFLFVFFSYY